MNVLGLCSVPELNNKYELSILFKSIQEQDEFFKSREVIIFDENGQAVDLAEDYSYLRENDVIKVPYSIEQLRGVNYLYFKNGNDITQYYFITRKEYKSDSVSSLYIQLDVIQTYFKYLDERAAFIEQAHELRFNNWNNLKVPNFGNKTAQNLEIGSEYYIDNSYEIGNESPLSYYYIYSLKNIEGSQATLPFRENQTSIGLECFVGFATDDGDEREIFFGNHKMSNLRDNVKGIYQKQGVFQIVLSKIPPVDWKITIESNKITVSDNFLSDGVTDYKPDNLGVLETTIDSTIQCIKLTKRNLIHQEKELVHGDINVLDYIVTNTSDDEIIYGNENYDDFYRKLNSDPYLQVYPFVKFGVKYGGNEIELKPEESDLTTLTPLGEPKRYVGKVSYEMLQGISATSSSAIRLSHPADTNYTVSDIKKSRSNLNHILTNQSPLFINIINDKWEQYELQNKNQREAGLTNIGISFAASAIGGAASIASGNILGILGVGAAGINAYSKVSQMLAKEQDIKNQPADLRTFNNDTSLITNTSGQLPVVTKYTVAIDYKIKAHNYFHRFGRKINKYAKINDFINTRKYFNFIKTSDYIAMCDKAEQDSLIEIENILNKGITFWHYDKNDTVNKIGNFDVNNKEVFNV